MVNGKEKIGIIQDSRKVYGHISKLSSAANLSGIQAKFAWLL